MFASVNSATERDNGQTRCSLAMFCSRSFSIDGLMSQFDQRRIATAIVLITFDVSNYHAMLVLI